MLTFGILRRAKDRPNEIVHEFDADEIYAKLLGGIHENLPELPKKRRFRKAPRGWTKAEISVAFLKSWSLLEKHAKRTTLRIP